MITSFQEQQPGLDYADPMPDGIPGPEDVPSALDVLGGIDHPVAKFWTQEAAFDVRHVGGSIYLGPPAEPTGQQACGSGRAARCPTTSCCTARCWPTRATR